MVSGVGIVGRERGGESKKTQEGNSSFDLVRAATLVKAQAP